MGKLPYRELVAWQKADALAHAVLDIVEASRPVSTRFWLRDQVCAAALSVPANLAEGNGRSTPLDYASFVDRSRGSLCELDYWLLFSAERGWIDQATHTALISRVEELHAMLLALGRRLRRMDGLPSRG